MGVREDAASSGGARLVPTSSPAGRGNGVLADIARGVGVVAAGLWSGLLLMLTTILHPVYATRGPRGFAQALRALLPVARTSPTDTVLVALLLLAAAVSCSPGTCTSPDHASAVTCSSRSGSSGRSA